jgi:hypothetical protein
VGDQETRARLVVFAGPECVAQGSLPEAAVAAWRALRGDPSATVLIFDDATGKVVDLDLRGGEDEVLARHRPAPVATSPRGRPRLGVISREVTLLPRHWDWLAQQPGGASNALRNLVDEARRVDDGATEARARTEAAYRFMSAMAGDRPGFEEASRALFGADMERLATCTAGWPPDIRRQLLGMLQAPAPNG